MSSESEYVSVERIVAFYRRYARNFDWSWDLTEELIQEYAKEASVALLNLYRERVFVHFEFFDYEPGRPTGSDLIDIQRQIIENDAREGLDPEHEIETYRNPDGTSSYWPDRYAQSSG